MRKMLSRCRRWFQSILSWTETPPASDTIFPPLLFNERRERLDTQGAGARDGARNHPPAAARVPDSFEYDIAHDITQAVRTAKTNCQQMVSELAADLRVNRCSYALIGINARLDSVLTTLLLAGHCRPQELHLLVTELRDEIGELNAFKRHERVTRPSRQLESRIAFVVLLVLLVVVEALLNGTLFSLSLDGGWLQGILYALTLSIVNVGVAFLAGRGGLPLINAKRPWPRALGWLSVACFAAWAVTLNLAIAHYRNGLANQVPYPDRAAMTTLVSQPLNLPEFNAWLLLTVGMVFACIAYWDGYRLGDPLHGFAQRAHAVRRARENYADALEDRNADLEDVREAGIELLESAGRELELGARQAAHAHARLRDLLLRFAAYVADAERIYQMLIEDYRAANQAARSEPPPAYFATRAVLAPVTLEPIALEPFDPREALDTLERSRKELNSRFFEAITAAAVDFDESFDEELERYVTHPESTTESTAKK